MKKFFVFLLFGFGILSAQNPGGGLTRNALPSFLEKEHNTSVRLISGTENFVPGESVTLGLVLEMKDHWHTYWTNPGDSGMPTTVDWELPEGFSAGEIIWSTPDRYVLEGLVSLGYEGKTILRVELQTPADFPVGSSVTVRGEVNWLECKEACLPGSDTVSLKLTSAETPGQVNAEMAAAEDLFYRHPDWEGHYFSEGDQVVLRVNAETGQGPFDHFFPFQEGAWMLNPEPEILETENGLEIRLTRNPGSPEPDGAPRGLLVNEEGIGFTLKSYRKDSAATKAGSPEVMETVAAGPSEKSLGIILVTAFLGGVLLNLLPCVFPVLGLKISGFLEQAQGDPKQAKIHSLVFAFGILCSLWILAAIVSSLNLAWGAQLGDPVTVITLVLLLSLFTLNLFGVFELGHMFTRLGGGVSEKKGYSGSFFSGVLVTVIATPCTGPFMAGAISWALTASAVHAFLAFTLLGLGIASPYVVLSFSPKLMEKLPRPGPWMETFKQGSAFFMLAFVWVLLWILSGLVPSAQLLLVLAGICIIMLAGWILGKWGAIHRTQKCRVIGKSVSVLLIVSAFWLSFSYQPPLDELDSELQQRIASGDPILYGELEPELYEILREMEVPVHWTPFTPEKLDSLLAENRPVFIDFTAKWCLTCQANKRSTLYRDEVLKSMQERGIVTLTADLTVDDPVLKKALASYGRRGVPTYILYNKSGDWTLLPETLTPGIVTGAIEDRLKP